MIDGDIQVLYYAMSINTKDIVFSDTVQQGISRVGSEIEWSHASPPKT
jgi:hypothetical protein